MAQLGAYMIVKTEWMPLDRSALYCASGVDSFQLPCWGSFQRQSNMWREAVAPACEASVALWVAESWPWSTELSLKPKIGAAWAVAVASAQARIATSVAKSGRIERLLERERARRQPRGTAAQVLSTSGHGALVRKPQC